MEPRAPSHPTSIKTPANSKTKLIQSKTPHQRALQNPSSRPSRERTPRVRIRKRRISPSEEERKRMDWNSELDFPENHFHFFQFLYYYSFFQWFFLRHFRSQPLSAVTFPAVWTREKKLVTPRRRDSFVPPTPARHLILSIDDVIMRHP